VVQHVDHLARREVGAVEDGPLAAGEPLPAGAAEELADGLALVDVPGGREVAGGEGAVGDAAGVLAAVTAEVKTVIHDATLLPRAGPEAAHNLIRGQAL
jgi:hypothetical protein